MDDGYGLNDDGLERCLSRSALSHHRGRLRDLLGLPGPYAQGAGESMSSSWITTRATPGNSCLPWRWSIRKRTHSHYFWTAGSISKTGPRAAQAPPQRSARSQGLARCRGDGTVADLVPLVDENRILVRKGLQQLARSRHRGVSALKDAAGVNGNPEVYDIGFKLGPRHAPRAGLYTAQVSLDWLMNARQWRRPAPGRRTPRYPEPQLASLDTHPRRSRGNGQEAQREPGAGIVPGSDDCTPASSASWRPGWSKSFTRPALSPSMKGDRQRQRTEHPRSFLGPGAQRLPAPPRRRGGHDMAAGLTLHRDNLDAFRERFRLFRRDHAFGVVHPAPRYRPRGDARPAQPRPPG